MRALSFLIAATLSVLFLMICAVLTAVITVSVLNHVAPPFPQWIVWTAAALTGTSITGAVNMAKQDW